LSALSNSFYLLYTALAFPFPNTSISRIMKENLGP
jgi:hypothetical protein